MLCFYHDDLDGRCAAAIVGRTATDVRFVAVDYRRPVPLNAVVPGETLIILDYTPAPDALRALRRQAGRVVWIDHHASTIDDPANADLEGHREVGRAACELTWQYFYPDKALPRAVQLTGDRDVWTWRYGEETAAFCEGIRLTPHDPQALIWKDLLDGQQKTLDVVLREGAVCRRYQRALAAEFIAKYGFETELDGQRCYAANFKEFGSDIFGERFDRYPICLCFVFDGSRFSVSLYSRHSDVLPIALRRGGGGHHQAAGFVCDRLPFAVMAPTGLPSPIPPA